MVHHGLSKRWVTRVLKKRKSDGMHYLLTWLFIYFHIIIFFIRRFVWWLYSIQKLVWDFLFLIFFILPFLLFLALNHCKQRRLASINLSACLSWEWTNRANSKQTERSEVSRVEINTNAMERKEGNSKWCIGLHSRDRFFLPLFCNMWSTSANERSGT